MTYRTVMVAIAALAAAAPLVAQHPTPSPQPHQDDVLARHLFPPELVMQRQAAIDLKAEQRAAITRTVRELQARALELQWQMQDETQRLTELIDRAAVDQAAALDQLDRVIAIEREMKRAHFAALLAIKNTLTAEQQSRLAETRSGPRR